MERMMHGFWLADLGRESHSLRLGTLEVWGRGVDGNFDHARVEFKVSLSHAVGACWASIGL